MATPPLTRDAKRARTVEALLEAASSEFARSGYAAASLEDIAVAAGYSKGAIYSNFDSKEDLFLAVLDRHDALLSASLEQALSQGTDVSSRLAALSRWFRDQVDSERDWVLLTLEFTMFAARNPVLRDRMAQRSRDIARTMTGIVAEQAGDLDLDLPMAPPDLARVVLALSSGIMTARLVDPDDDLQDVFVRAVSLLLGQGGATSDELASGPPSA